MAPGKIIISLMVAFLHSGLAVAAAPAYKDLEAEKIEYDVATGAVKTSGKTNVALVAGQKITLKDAYLESKKASAGSVVVEWNENTLMTAETFKKDGDISNAEYVTYTACRGCDDVGTAWTIHATDMTHDSEAKQMYFYNFWFDAYGLPIFYLPFWSQPDPTVKRRSGLLFPEMGSSTNMGTKIDIPLYVAFSDNHDMTITGSYFTKENPMTTVDHRLRLAHSSFDTTGSYTHTEDNLNRWHLFHSDTIDMGENMRFTANIQRTSDKTYLQKYNLYSDQPFLESNAKLAIYGQKGYATVGTSIFQELRQAVRNSNDVIPKGDIIPRVHANYQMGIAEDLYSEWTGDFLRIDSKGDSSMNRAIGELRMIAPVETMWQKWTFSAAVRNDYYSYNNIQLAPTDNASRVLPSGYVDWEMPFVRTGESWTQIIKPKARITVIGKSDNDDFLNMDSVGALLSDSSLFVNNRYSGYDMWVNGTYADYGLSWTGYNSAMQSAEIFVGQTYDFDTENDPDINSGYGRRASDIVGRVAVNPTQLLTITNRFRFGKDELDLRHLETDMRIGNRTYVGFGYIWAVQFSKESDTYIRDSDISEGTFETGMYLTNKLAIRANGIYNFTNEVFQRYNAGLYYEHPCYLIGLVYDVDNAIKVDGMNNPDLDFKGVSSLKLKFSIKMGTK